MTDNLPQPLPEITPDDSPVASEVLTAQPKKSKRMLWLIAPVSIAIILTCTIICVTVIVLGLRKVAVEKAPVESVLDSYMTYMAAKDAESAYALFSPRVQRQFPVSKLKELTAGNNYVIFEGYQSLTVQNLNISAVANTNQDVPQGTVAKVSGVIKYDGGIQGTFNGTLEKVDGKWQLFGIFVTVPPDKFQP